MHNPDFDLIKLDFPNCFLVRKNNPIEKMKRINVLYVSVGNIFS